MDKTLTKEKLETFIKLRNESNYSHNLAFEQDGEKAGIDVNQLGQPEKLGENHYQWLTPFGVLVEEYGKLTLDTSPRLFFDDWIKCTALVVHGENVKYIGKHHQGGLSWYEGNQVREERSREAWKDIVRAYFKTRYAKKGE